MDEIKNFVTIGFLSTKSIMFLVIVLACEPYKAVKVSLDDPVVSS